MVRKPQNSNDMNSKFEKVVRELRARFRGGVLPWRWWFPRFQGVIRALDHTIWLHLRPTFIKGIGRDQGFRVPELCAAGAIGIE